MPERAWRTTGAALLLAAVLLAAGGPSLAQQPPAEAPDQPAPRRDANSQIAHAQLVEKAKQGRIDLYFLGDSIVRRWGALDYPDFLAHWKATFHGWNAANFGWGADGTQHVLWRIENGELDGVDPKVIVLLAGTNNVEKARGEAEIDAVARGVKAIVDTCRRKAPGATIVVTAIFPRHDHDMALMPAIDRINRQIAALADGNRVRFLDVNDRLADANGVLVPGVLNADKLHPSLAGYRIWADALKPILRDLLGPPAATDLAPPPTGNPSAAKPPA